MPICVLGIDPGLVRLGLGVVIICDDQTLSLGQGGVISHPKTGLPFNQHLNQGIYQIADQFPQLLHMVRPNFIVAEIVPVGRLGSNTELNVAAITTCKVIAWQWGIDWHDMGANTIKKQVTDDGQATKTKIRNTVIKTFPILGEKHKEMKQEQKANGDKPIGLPQDLFDAVAICLAGIKIYGNDYSGSPPSGASGNI